MWTGIVEFLTPLHVLYGIAGLLCLSFAVESGIYISNTSKIKRWKPDISQMHYVIKTVKETCVPHYIYDESRDIYTVEYHELLTGRMIVKRLITVEQYATETQAIRAVDVEVSVLRIYIITPNGHVLYRDFTRTDRDENYRAFKKEDMSFNLLRVSAEYFKRNCPQERNQSKKKTSDIKYVEGLPYVLGAAKKQ